MLGHIFPRCYNNMIQRQLIMKRKVLKLFMKFAEDCLKKSTVVHPIKVKEMIIMTKHHFTDAHASTEVFGTEDVHYLLDCDMGRREKCMRNVLQLFVKNMLTLTT